MTPYPLLLLSTEMVVAPTETPGVAIRSSSLPDQGSDDEDNSCDEEEEVKKVKISVFNVTVTVMCHIMDQV